MKNKWVIFVLLLIAMGLLMIYIGYDKLVLDKENPGGNDNGQNNSTPKVIKIYKDEYTIADYNKNGVYQGKITCNTPNCELEQAYEKYAIIKESEKYYLYNYLSDSLVFGPFEVMDYDIWGSVFVYENKLIGIYYQNMDKYNFYSVEANKSFPTIEGTMLTSTMDYDASVLKKYGYFAIDDEEKTNFINLNNGKVEFSIANTLHYIDEDDEKQNLYLSFYNENTEKYSVYNQLGKKLYDNVSSFTLKEKKILISYGKNFEIRDSSHKLIHSSKDYDEVLDVDTDYAVVLNGGYLRMIDMKDNVLATFERKWDKNKYDFHSPISGWYTENGKYGIYLVIEDKTIPYGTKGSGIEFYYIPTTKESGIIETDGVGGYAKPILYLYPTLKTNITVNFENPSLLTTTYPKFQNRWEVIAYPNGDLYDKNGNYYYALYWEEAKNHSIDFSKGFYVEKEDAIDFLEEKLSIIGLNDKERNEFIMYWLPIIEKNEKNLVYFELTEERDSYNKLIIAPKPDSLLRVAIHVKKVNEKISIKEQELTTFNRKGFTAVEWGGVNY